MRSIRPRPNRFGLVSAANQAFGLYANTSDGADNQYIVIGGGQGASGAGNVQTRGGCVFAYGNEAATFGGDILFCAGEAGYQAFYNAAGVEAFRFTGGELRCPAGNIVGGANGERWIGSFPTNPGYWQVNTPAAGGIGFSSNGAAHTAFDVTSIFTPGTVRPYSISNNQIICTRTNAASDNKGCYMSGAGAYDPTRGAGNEVVGINATNEAGANIRRATGKALAASTSYNLVAVAATDCGFIRLVDNVGATSGAVVTILNGAITAIAGDTASFVQTAPTATQCQLTIAGGFLVATTGSGWTKKVGVFGDLTRMV